MSIWNKKEIKTEKLELSKNIEVDTLIIGAGMTGMTTAYYLRNQKSLCVVDASIVGHGVTLGTTAKINYFQERIYTKISSITDENTASRYLSSQRYAIDNLKNIVDQEKINCDFTQVPSYVFANTEKEVEPLKKEISFLKEQGINVIKKKLPNKITQYDSYCVNDTYIFNPLKYLKGIYDILRKNNVPVYENNKIIKIDYKDDKYICYGSKYSIKAKKVILACHYPFFIMPLLFPTKSYIEKSYIVVSKINKDGGFTCISSGNPVYSCRFYNDGNNIYQISLSESHNTSIKQNDSEHFNRVKQIFNLKDNDIVSTYSNVDIMTPDHMPYIGKIKNNMYIGVGYNTWGMTNSVLAAKILSDIVIGNRNLYQDMFNPKRVNLAIIGKLPYIMASQTKSYLGPKINKNKPWYSDRITFIRKDGKSLAIYKDETGLNHIVYNKCPHFGCSLIFNEKEKTWDCPCHSSRFDIDGNCIKGPSTFDISYKK